MRGETTIVLRQKASITNWDTFYDTDLNKHAQNVTNHIIAIARNVKPSKPDGPAKTKRLIRKHKREYKKAKPTNLHKHWVNSKHHRKRVTYTNRDLKQSLKNIKNKVADKLKSYTLSSKDCWGTLKSVIDPNSKSSVPPLEKDGIVIDDDLEKVNVLMISLALETRN